MRSVIAEVYLKEVAPGVDNARDDDPIGCNFVEGKPTLYHQMACARVNVRSSGPHLGMIGELITAKLDVIDPAVRCCRPRFGGQVQPDIQKVAAGAWRKPNLRHAI